MERGKDLKRIIMILTTVSLLLLSQIIFFIPKGYCSYPVVADYYEDVDEPEEEPEETEEERKEREEEEETEEEAGMTQEDVIDIRGW